MIARDENELKLYEEMDAERKVKETYDPRLIANEGVPNWLKLKNSDLHDILVNEDELREYEENSEGSPK